MSSKTRALDGKRWFTVIGFYEDTHQLFTSSFRSTDEQAAFTDAVKDLSEAEISALTLVAAVPGSHHAYAPDEREGKTARAMGFALEHVANLEADRAREEALDREYAGLYGDCEQ